MSEPTWDFFFYRRGDAHPVSAYADLTADSDAAKSSRPVLLTVDVPMKRPRPDGLSSQEEADMLYKLEDALMARLDSRPASQFVGRITEQGHRVWYFYLKDAGGIEVFIDTVCKAANYSAFIHADADPAWSTYYMVLRPNEIELQEILDRRVLVSLQENGDDLSQPRGIHHWIYFDKVDARDRFIAGARAMGFACRPLEPDPKSKDRPFGAGCHRVDSVSPPGIHQVVADLDALARQLGGEYDGWECQIVKPGETPKEDRPADAH